ncbi:LacI family DNA-binding transcriptional regulator [Planctomycetota bacterium]|nr:LacI family DNA-binding transcriptional regulator [Planctomycetota bacterium]
MSIISVAKIAGVSHATVSRVINNRPGVADKTIKVVKSAMQQVGYRPAAKRRGPKAKNSNSLRTGNIAVLFFNQLPTLSNAPIASQLLNTIENVLSAKGANLLLGQIKNETNLPPSVIAKQVDGLLLYGNAPSSKIRERLECFPSVWLMSQRSRHGYWGSRVQPDNRAIGHLAAEYLHNKSCKRLLYIHLDYEHWGMNLRYSSFCEAVSDYKISKVIKYKKKIAQASINSVAIEDFIDMQIKYAFGNRVKPDGIFIPRATAAGFVYKSLRKVGIHPGNNLHIICCDQSEVLTGLDPTPETIDIQVQTIADKSVNLLFQIINEGALFEDVNMLTKPQFIY